MSLFRPKVHETQNKMNDPLVERVHAAMGEAETAAQSAFEAFRQSASKDAHGHIRDTCGLAFAYVRTTRRGKRALVKAGYAHPQPGLNIVISAFDVPEQSLTAQEVAIQAGIKVLQQRIGDIGEFHFTSRMD